MSVFVQQNGNYVSFNSDESWVILSPIEHSIKKKIEAAGVPLKEWDVSINYGIKTGCNEAFIIDEATKDRLISEDPKSADVIRPILRGRDIKRYKYSDPGLFVLYIPWHFPLTDIEEIRGASDDAEEKFARTYPAVYNHLLQFREKLSTRNQAETGIRYEWYALQRYGAKYMDEFSKQKIIFQEMVQSPAFCLDKEVHFMCLDKVDSRCIYQIRHYP